MAVPWNRCTFRCICPSVGCALPIQYIPSTNQAYIRPLIYVLSEQDSTGAVRPRRISSRNIIIIDSFFDARDVIRGYRTPLCCAYYTGHKKKRPRTGGFLRNTRQLRVVSSSNALGPEPRMFPNSSPNHKQGECGRAGTDSQEITRHANTGKLLSAW